jgi:hypothetical protein
MAVNYAGTGAPDGENIGRSGGKLAFYEVTPVIQPVPAVTVGTDITTVILELADLRAAMVALGTIAS